MFRDWLALQVESESPRIWKCTEQKPRCAIQRSIDDSCAYKMKNYRGLNVSHYAFEPLPLRPTPLLFQSVALRCPGCDVLTTRCCMSLQVRFILCRTGKKQKPNADCDIAPEGTVRRSTSR